MLGGKEKSIEILAELDFLFSCSGGKQRHNEGTGMEIRPRYANLRYYNFRYFVQTCYFQFYISKV